MPDTMVLDSWFRDRSMERLYRREAKKVRKEDAGSFLDSTEDWAVLRFEYGSLETFDTRCRATRDPHRVPRLSPRDALRLRRATRGDTIAPTDVVQEMLQAQRFVEQAQRRVRDAYPRLDEDGQALAERIMSLLVEAGHETILTEDRPPRPVRPDAS